MCGICGFVGSDPALTPAVLENMNLSLVRRGPDDGGAYVEPGVGLAMRRLSIIDLGGGHQPIHNEDRSIWVVFNGEIYNYRELRKDLLARGHAFQTQSDTEVIVHLYEEYGDDAVNYLQGMFAFALWDTRRRRALIARDRLGIKPLYYSQSRDTILFASEIKALLASGRVESDIDPQGLDAFLAFTYIPAPLTIYAGIRKLEPGCLLTIENGRSRIRRYWDLDVSVQDEKTDEQTWLERFEHAIDDAIRSHLVSDVPVGAFLSGGIDSSLVVALMSRHLDQPVATFTMGLGGSSSLIDERPLAKQLAERYGCSFHEYTVQPDFRSIVGEIVEAFDEPFADDSVIPSYYVSQFARRGVKVALSGLGGDELFAGYQRYSGVLLAQTYSRIVPPTIHSKVVQPLVGSMPEPSHGGDRIDHMKRFSAAALDSSAQRYLGFVSSMPAGERLRLYSPDLQSKISTEETGRLITDPFNRCEGPDDVSRCLYVDMKTYLPEDILALSDRLSMWHSLEVRVPLVDHKLVELSAQLPARYKINWRGKKRLLRGIASKHLPKEILTHRKQGFESPMASWLRTDLVDYAKDILGPRRLGRTGYFDHPVVARHLENHLSGRSKNNKLLFSLIMLQEWFERKHLSN